MPRILIAILTFSFCSIAFADPVLYVCERPAWDGVDGCGPHNTYATYKLLVNTNDFKKKHSEYTFRGSKGCNANRGHRYSYAYRANGDTIKFAFDPKPGSSNSVQMSTITLDLDSMKAVMSGVKESPELTCRVEPT
ncbi:MAG: hypothetical protein OQJ84_02505 [Xanthomonadales bacterium]|nr:hypothetical protein [Xanthomonadales bacterium]